MALTALVLRLDLVSAGRGRRGVAHALRTAPLWIEGTRHHGQRVDNPAGAVPRADTGKVAGSSGVPLAPVPEHRPIQMSFGDAAFEMGDVPSAKHTEVFAGQRHPGPLPVRPRCWPRPWIMRVPARPPCRPW